MTSSALAETFMLRPIYRIFVLSAACLLAACATTGRMSSDGSPSAPANRLPDGFRPVVTPQQNEFSPAEAATLPATSAASRAIRAPAPHGRPTPEGAAEKAGGKDGREKLPSAMVESADRTPWATPDPEANVYFASGGSDIDESGKALLRRHAARLKDNPDQVVTLIGHTDPTGSRSYNLAIAEERIAAVVHALRAFGVPRWQIRTVNSGRGEAPGTCASIACRARMWRVELVFSE